MAVRRYLKRWRWPLRIVLFYAAMLLTIALIWGRAETLDFSPDTFEYRSSWYCPIPLTLFPLMPPVSRKYTIPFFDYLHDNGFVDVKSTGTVRWRFVRGSCPGFRGWIGEARWFYFSDGNRLVKWSNERPQLARALWPIVVDLARREQYFAANEMINMCTPDKAMTLEEFQERIKHAREWCSLFPRE